MTKDQVLLQKLYEIEQNPSVDPELHEYLTVMQPRKGARTWSNDDGVARAQKSGARVKARVEEVALRRPGGEVNLSVLYCV